MIYSMTGFGKADFQLRNKNFYVEVKTLNSKQTDMYFRLPTILQEMEMELRNIVVEFLFRGKINVSIQSADNTETESYKIDIDVLNHYFEQIKGITTKKEDVLSTILGMPNVVISSKENLKDEEKNIVTSALKSACMEAMLFRLKEGNILKIDLEERINKIIEGKNKIEKLAPERIEKIKTRIKENLTTLKTDLSYNEDRFEQELVYYIEKLDITEEFVRLDAHTKYFIEELSNKDNSVGKKLNFISQEIGREINTIGSKANDADIQKEVVQMKDELEKIKEQVNNIL